MSPHFVTKKINRPYILGIILGAILLMLGLMFVILGTQMGAKSTEGRLWDPIVPPGGPLSAQGCHLARFAARFGVSLGSHSVPK